MITYFKTVMGDHKSFPYLKPIDEAFKRIKNGNSKDLIEQVRLQKDKAERNAIKKKLPAICFSGEFSERADSKIVNHSGFICLDFDGYIDDYDMGQSRDRLIKDKYSYSVFTSPSGDGLKVIVKIPKDIENHKAYFMALEKYYDSAEFDTSCKNISRVCYESYDPDIFINELSLTWTEALIDKKPAPVSKPTIIINSTSEVIKRLIVWWNKDFGMVEGAKNNNLLVLAYAFNEYGINKSEALAALLNYDEGGKEAEITNVLNNAYKDTSKHNTKHFEDYVKVDMINAEIKKGVPISEVIKLHKETAEETIMAIVDSIDKEQLENFWIKSSKGVVSHVNHLYKRHLESEGNFKYYPSGSDNFVFINIKDNVISNTNEDIMKDEIMDHLYALDDMSIWNYFADKSKLFKEDHLSFLSKKEVNFMEDTEHEAYIYYNNCAVRVTKEGVQTVDYMDIDGFIWDKQKINRDYVSTDFDDCEYRKFISNIGGGIDQKIASIESTIGFLLHSYKPSSYCPAVILNDEVISDNPEGGTGKGIFNAGIGHIKEGVVIDCKSFVFGKNFSYSRVSVSTQVLTYDDIPRGWDFEKIFPIITEGMTIEKKNKDEIFIPFRKSPKILISSNYAVKGSGNSFDRRKWELEFSQHYNKDKTPRDEFGHDLFTGWDDVEWTKFDNYMLNCLSNYLRDGLIKSDFKNLKERKFIAETNFDFYNWMKDCVHTTHGSSVLGQTLYNNFIDENSDFGVRGRYQLTLIKFYKWIDLYGEFMYGQKPFISKVAEGKMVKFERKIDKQTEIKI